MKSRPNLNADVFPMEKIVLYADRIVKVHDDPNFPYSHHSSGSCFFLEWKKRVFIVTAQHCLDHQEPFNVRAGYFPKESTWVPLKKMFFRQKQLRQEFDYTDLAFLEVDLNKISPEHFDSLNIIPSKNVYAQKLNLDSMAPLLVAGFPGALSEIDYDKGVIVHRSFLASTSYIAKTNDDFCHSMRFDDLGLNMEFGGFSGSPVFSIFSVPLIPYGGFMLVGMMIRGSQSSMLGTFIESYVLVKALEEITRN